MQCGRCDAELVPPIARSRWCKRCDLAYDGWSRQYAADIVWQVLGATTVVALVALGLPLLGLPTVLAGTGIFAGAGTLAALSRLNTRRRRKQFTTAGAVPRAYLPEKV